MSVIYKQFNAHLQLREIELNSYGFIFLLNENGSHIKRLPRRKARKEAIK